MKTKLIEITSLEQLKVGDWVKNGEWRKYVLAITGELVWLSLHNKKDKFDGVIVSSKLVAQGYQQEVPDEPWRPKHKEVYFYPLPTHVSLFNEGHYIESSIFDEYIIKNGLCYKTKEEAVERAKRMLEAN